MSINNKKPKYPDALDALAFEKEIARWPSNRARSHETRAAIFDNGELMPNVVLRRFESGEPTPHRWWFFEHEIDPLLDALTRAKAMLASARAERPTHSAPVAYTSNNNRSMRPERTRGRGAL
jgi:hypothetical protein